MMTAPYPTPKETLMPAPLETPRYRVTVASAVINGRVYSRDAEVSTNAWPDQKKLEPINDAAHRVFEHAREHRFDLHRTRTPYNLLLKSVYLPGALPRFFSPLRHEAAG